MLDLPTLNRMRREAFIAAIGSSFEHSPWIAGQAWDPRPFDSVDALHAAMLGVRRAQHAEFVEAIEQIGCITRLRLRARVALR